MQIPVDDHVIRVWRGEVVRHPPQALVCVDQHVRHLTCLLGRQFVDGRFQVPPRELPRQWEGMHRGHVVEGNIVEGANHPTDVGPVRLGVVVDVHEVPRGAPQVRIQVDVDERTGDVRASHVDVALGEEVRGMYRDDRIGRRSTDSNGARSGHVHRVHAHTLSSWFGKIESTGDACGQFVGAVEAVGVAGRHGCRHERRTAAHGVLIG